MEWIKRNKLSVFLLFVIFLLMVSRFVRNPQTFRAETGGIAMDTSSAPMMAKTMMPITESYAPQPGVANRLVVQESSLSLQVADVSQRRDQIVEYAKKQGGYMVNANTTHPAESPTATITIRIPSEKIEETLTFLRSLALKVVSENLTGYDVTDQYIDVEKRIALLESTIEKYETILKSATEISDITNLNREIINTQNEIDMYKGQQEALAQNAAMARLTVYLATDDIALPYAPNDTWRPSVIFKLAVRSLVSDLRSIGTGAIWLVVYAVFWVPIVILLWVGYRAYRNNLVKK